MAIDRISTHTGIHYSVLKDTHGNRMALCGDKTRSAMPDEARAITCAECQEIVLTIAGDFNNHECGETCNECDECSTFCDVCGTWFDIDEPCLFH
jgi:hypothetical protein